jgi:hypothetical protein
MQISRSDEEEECTDDSKRTCFKRRSTYRSRDSEFNEVDSAILVATRAADAAAARAKEAIHVLCSSHLSTTGGSSCEGRPSAVRNKEARYRIEVGRQSPTPLISGNPRGYDVQRSRELGTKPCHIGGAIPGFCAARTAHRSRCQSTLT